jgi:hypothetical protein
MPKIKVVCDEFEDWWMLMMKRMFKHLKCLIALRNKFMCMGMIMQMLKIPRLLILIALELRHASYLVCKGNLMRS